MLREMHYVCPVARSKLCLNIHVTRIADSLLVHGVVENEHKPIIHHVQMDSFRLAGIM